MISKETIDEILQKVNIVDLVSLYAEVKHKGSSYVACCPFHNEKTPSFHISPEKGVYHCFGCGESGNIFSFIMKMTGASFSDAAVELANKFDIEIKYTDTKFKDNKKDIDAIYKVNVLAYKYFEYSLKSNFNLIKEYLEKRKISSSAIRSFYIGFAPNSWQGLYDFLKKVKVPENVMEQSGLFYRNQSGKLYDVFRGRLMFPVITQPKKISGFGGRIIPSIVSKEELDKQPKYLNSRETLVYEKSKILYNFYNAREEIKKQKSLFLVEGYMDVVGLSRVNVRNVVATCGTSLTLEHAKKIEALNVKVIVMFDADNAGYNAAARAFTIFLNTKINAEALFLPNGEDPDSLADKEGENTLNFLNSLPRISLLDAYLKKLLRDENLENINEASASIKEKISDTILETISKIQSGIKKLETLKEASFLLQIPIEILENELKKPKYKLSFNSINNDNLSKSNVIKIINNSSQSSSSSIGDSKIAPELKKIMINKLPSLDREVLSIMLKDLEYVDIISKNSSICQVLTHFMLEFIDSLKSFLQQNQFKSHNEDGGNFLGEFQQFLMFYGKDYLMLSKSLSDDSNSFNPKGAYQQCEKLALRLQKEGTIRDLEREIQITKDEQTRILLVKKLFEIKKNI